jgi:polyferredoxin
MPWGLTVKRRIVQTASLFMLHSNVFSSAVAARFCLPVMNCDACAVAWLGCPIGMLGRSLAFNEIPWLVLLMVLGLGLLVGRLFCGWVCPMGFLQDLLHKIPSRKFQVPRWATAIKYAVLAVSVVGVTWLVGTESPFFYCNFCPTAGMQVVLPVAIADHDWSGVTSRLVKMVFVVAVLISGIFVSRSFCKVMCPVGAWVALTNRLTPFRLDLDDEVCVKCKKCDKACPMTVPVMSHCEETSKKINRELECIECLNCQAGCPVKAIQVQVLQPNRKDVKP